MLSFCALGLGYIGCGKLSRKGVREGFDPLSFPINPKP